jgi:hypothetical protein
MDRTIAENRNPRLQGRDMKNKLFSTIENYLSGSGKEREKKLQAKNC